MAPRAGVSREMVMFMVIELGVSKCGQCRRELIIVQPGFLAAITA